MSPPRREPASPATRSEPSPRDDRARRETASGLEDEMLGPATAQHLAEEERLGMHIPRVRALTTEDLEINPPPRERYRVRTLQKLAELWRARELLFTFVERDLRVRYKQAVLGAFWAIAQPLFLMVVFSVVFGRIANIPTDGITPYAIFSYTALVPFQLFASSLNYGTSSIVSNWATIRKIYMPREIFPLASVASASFDFLVSSVILLGMLIAFGYYPQVEWVAYPVLLIVLLMITTAVTMVASMTTAYIRDTRYGIPLLIQVLMFATPVAYPLSEARKALPAGVADIYTYLNPLVPVFDGFRRVLAKGQWPEWGPLGAAAAVGLVAMALIYRWYKRVDPNFADVV